MSIRKGDYSRAEQHYTQAMALLDACNLVALGRIFPCSVILPDQACTGNNKDILVIPVLSPLLAVLLCTLRTTESWVTEGKTPCKARPSCVAKDQKF